jgi:hypothetical protein
MKKPTKKGAVYSVKSIDGGWEVFDRGGHCLSAEPQPKNDAVIHAKELARHDGAQILIYAENGKLESEFFYQRDERASLSHDDSVRSLAASEPVTHGRR